MMKKSRDPENVNRIRYFSNILCVKNAPHTLTNTSLYRGSLATDIVVGMRSLGESPRGYSSYLGIGGAIKETCNAEKHPLIIDFKTQKITSINEKAMSEVHVFDAIKP